MLVLLAFAFVSGIITILSPCILPVLPIVLSGSVGGGKARPLGIITAFVVSFTVFTLALSAIVQAVGVSPDALRIVAVVFLIAFGLVMLVPALRDRFELLTSRLASRGTTPSHGAVSPADSPPRGAGAARLAGFWSGLPVGFSLGLVWTPCVGPIMASVISLALTQRVDSGSIFITLAYALGTSIPMLAVMVGGRALLQRVPALKRNSGNIQKVFGVLMVLVGISIAVGWDRQIQTALLRAFPSYGSGLTAIEDNGAVGSALSSRRGNGAQFNADMAGKTTAQLMNDADTSNRLFSGADGHRPANGRLADYGIAPGFSKAGPWFNTDGLPGVTAGGSAARSQTAGSADSTVPGSSPPLTLADLRGKVVIVDFWTYSCVNCIRTIPYLKEWYKTYKDKGLVIIGVHTPEFEFEKNSSNVQAAMKQLGVTWPVVQDNSYRVWNAYGNQYWPAHYFIDAKGHVRYFHFGEGDYATSEKVIQELLREQGERVSGIVSRPDFVNTAQTPETYLGFDRGRGFSGAVQPVANVPTVYSPSAPLQNGQWNLEGKWTINAQYVVPDASGTLHLGFDARNVYLVVAPEPDSKGSIQVMVDGKQAPDTPDVKDGVVTPKMDRLYQLIAMNSPGKHVLTLKVTGKLRLYAFTFG